MEIILFLAEAADTSVKSVCILDKQQEQGAVYDPPLMCAITDLWPRWQSPIRTYKCRSNKRRLYTFQNESKTWRKSDAVINGDYIQWLVQAGKREINLSFKKSYLQ